MRQDLFVIDNQYQTIAKSQYKFISTICFVGNRHGMINVAGRGLTSMKYKQTESSINRQNNKKETI